MNNYYKAPSYDMESAMFDDYVDELIAMEKLAAFDRLVEIDQTLNKYSLRDAEIIMNFLCRDEKFKEITGGSRAILSNYIKQQSNEVVGYVAASSGGGAGTISMFAKGWGIWKWVHTKTVKGLAEWMKDHNPNTIDDSVFERKAKVPNIKDFETMQEAITKALPLLEKLVSGKEVNDNELEAAIKTMGFTVDMSRFDSYSGHVYAFLNMVVKGIGINIAAIVGTVLVGVASGGILAIPAAIYASIWAGMKQSAAYKQAYEKWQADASLIEKGWNKPNFMKALTNFKMHYNGVMGYATKLDKLTGGEVYTRTESAHAHLFADVILLEIKTEARILGTIVALLDKLLSASIKG